jgi:hypothetical protein
MTLAEELELFYKKYNLPENGGVNDRMFGVPLPFFTLMLPNYAWRKKKLHIHDLEHILNQQNTSWAGECFIASWEIATGFWKYFPLCVFPLWTIGYGLFIHPSSVVKGFLKGRKDKGIAALNLPKEKLLGLNIETLSSITEGLGGRKTYLNIPALLLWSITALLVFLSPVIFLTGILWILF